MNHNLRVTHEVTDKTLDLLVQFAFISGWARKKPNMPWTIEEKKDAGRHAIQSLLASSLQAIDGKLTNEDQ